MIKGFAEHCLPTGAYLSLSMARLKGLRHQRAPPERIPTLYFLHRPKPVSPHFTPQRLPIHRLISICRFSDDDAAKPLPSSAPPSSLSLTLRPSLPSHPPATLHSTHLISFSALAYPLWCQRHVMSRHILLRTNLRSNNMSATLKFINIFTYIIYMFLRLWTLSYK